MASKEQAEAQKRIADQNEQLASMGMTLLFSATTHRFYVRAARRGVVCNPAGYVTRVEAYEAFEQLTKNARELTEKTNAAYAEYKAVAQGTYTHASPKKFHDLYRAAFEYERIERLRIGCATRTRQA